MLDASSPELAIGMVSSLGRAAQRDRVRRTVFDSPAASRVAWRFLVGNNTRGGAGREPQGDVVPDVLRFSTDGGASSKHCSCSEKTRFWFTYALRRWPSVSWIAKTEDDTYLHLGKLLADLAAPPMEPSRAAADGHVMYGLMNLCTATPYSRTNAGCFLGDMETQSTVLSSMSKARGGGCKAFPAAPFPTGPLAVMSAGLAREVFERCEYMQGYSAAAAALGGTCLNSRVGNTFLNLNACDCSIGGWIQQCVPTLSLGSMTWTKGHHNAQTGGGLGWVRPDDQSIAVHYLKTDAAEPWQAAHNASRDTPVPAFPPIMWQYDNPAGGPPSVSVAEGSKALQAWYQRTCRQPPSSFVQEYIRKRGGGNPRSWASFGCHQVRGHPTPIPEKDANYRREAANYLANHRSAGYYLANYLAGAAAGRNPRLGQDGQGDRETGGRPRTTPAERLAEHFGRVGA